MQLAAPDPAEVEWRETRCQRLEQALENRNDELRQVEREIGWFTGQIQTAGGEGVGEALACRAATTASFSLEAGAARACSGARRDAAVVAGATVSTCLTEGREYYYAPVRRHLRPFLQHLFPGAELELGDGFEIMGIKRQCAEIVRAPVRRHAGANRSAGETGNGCGYSPSGASSPRSSSMTRWCTATTTAFSGCSMP